MTQAKASENEHRRQNRLEIQDNLPVTNIHSGEIMGQLANLSAEGLMLVSTECIEIGKVYQLSIPLSAEGVADTCIQVGAESLWCDDINGSGTYWTGFHLEEISQEDQEILDKLVMS